MKWVVSGVLTLLLGSIIVLEIFFYPQTTQLKHNNIKTQIISGIKKVSPFAQTAFTPQNPTLDHIFSDNHSWTATLSAERVKTLIFTGDVIPARSVNFKANQYKSFTWSFEKTAGIVQNADLTIINLETPLMRNCNVTTEGMNFCGDAHHVEGLRLIGTDLASFANNHMGNHGPAGVLETKQLLINNDITPFGLGEPVYKVVKGTRFAFLGYNDIGAKEPLIGWADKEVIATDIAEAKKHADLVIVEYHWGVEYRDQPDSLQKELGHFTIDSGADLVIGNHPHWIQPIEFYKGKLITYAHGNYVFDQMWSEETKHGVIGKYTFYDNQLVDVEYFPLYIQDYGQASFLDTTKKEAILLHMKQQSYMLSTQH